MSQPAETKQTNTDGLSRAATLFQEIIDFEKTNNLMPHSERMNRYGDINQLLQDNSLPADKVYAFETNIVTYEWGLAKPKLREQFFQEHKLLHIADFLRPEHVEPETIFQDVLKLFPKVRTSLADGFKKHNENLKNILEKDGTYAIHADNLFPITNVFLMEQLGATKQEIKTEVKHWLANYFIYGKAILPPEASGFNYKEVEETVRAVKLFMERCGVQENEITEIAQSVIHQFSCHKIWPGLDGIGNLLDNLHPLVTQQLDWHEIDEKRLVDIYNTTRMYIQTLLSVNQHPSSFELWNFWVNTIEQYCQSWFAAESQKPENNHLEFVRFAPHANNNEILSGTDRFLTEEVKILGNRLGMDMQKLNKLLTENPVSSEQIASQAKSQYEIIIKIIISESQKMRMKTLLSVKQPNGDIVTSAQNVRNYLSVTF
jgi:hypothetical protein